MTMYITKRDVYWNYAATFLRMASSALLLPFILRMMPSEMVGIWTVFITLTAFSNLLDFGFNPSFARNISYIFSGVRSLKKTGFEIITYENPEVDFGLLKGVISAMRWFYFRMALILFIILSTIGTWYISSILENYKGDKVEVYLAWGLLCIINSYNIFTLYYDSLMQGKGLIKKSKQIIIIGNVIYLVFATVLILLGKGLVAIVFAQASSVLAIRWLSYRAFFTSDFKKLMSQAVEYSKSEVIKVITPNAVKIGLTAVGSFLVSRSAIVIGSLYLSLEEIAKYGITIQLVFLVANMAGIFTATYYPKIAQLRVGNNLKLIRDLYLKGLIILFFTYIIGSICLVYFGTWSLELIGSKTQLLPKTLILFALIVSFLESNHAVAGSMLLSKNEVPFFKASLISGVFTVVLLFLLFKFTDMGIWAMIIAPGISQAAYQNWKWPTIVFKELMITKSEIFKSIKEFVFFFKK